MCAALVALVIALSAAAGTDGESSLEPPTEDVSARLSLAIEQDDAETVLRLLPGLDAADATEAIVVARQLGQCERGRLRDTDGDDVARRHADDAACGAAQGRPERGDRFRDCAECPEMVVLPAGSYRMGSGRYEVEGPVHEVTIAAPFAIGRHEVTVAEFGRFVDETGYSAGSSCVTYENGEDEDRAGRSWRNPGFGQSGRHPVVCVNWNDAQAYVAWLSRQTGGGIPPAERVGVGVRGAGGHGDRALLGRGRVGSVPP